MAPQGRPNTRPVSAADADAYLAKAAEFLRAAQDALHLGNHTAATSNAVHAGIAVRKITGREWARCSSPGDGVCGT